MTLLCSRNLTQQPAFGGDDIAFPTLGLRTKARRPRVGHSIRAEMGHSCRVPRLLDLSGKVEVTASSVVVTLDKRAHNPYLVASGLADQPTPMPWFGDKKLFVQFA